MDAVVTIKFTIENVIDKETMGRLSFENGLTLEDVTYDIMISEGICGVLGKDWELLSVEEKE